MKIKMFASCITSLLSLNLAFSQIGSPTARFQATITASSPNSVMIAIRPNENFSGQFANVQFTLQIPSSVNPAPSVSVKSNPLSTYLPIGLFNTSVEGGFTTYAYNVNTAGSPVFTFNNGVQFNALEVQFTGGSGTTEVRLSHLPDGGITLQAALYVEVNGNDNTNYPAPFYGAGAVNSGNSTGGAYSYLPLAGIVLPIKFTSFTAVKKANDAILTWAVQNESSTNLNYEVERSINGIQFEKINTINPYNNSSSSNVYTIVDENIVNVKNNGIFYYRIRQIDVDGKLVYSEIKSIRVNDVAILSAFPNPTKTFTTIKIEATATETININIVNSDGKQVQNVGMQVQKGVNLKAIDLSTLAAGNYLIKAIIGNQQKTIPIIKL